MRPDERVLGRAQRLGVVLDHLGLAFPDEDVRAPIGAHVERLVACVQDEYLMHGVASVPASMALRPGFVAPEAASGLPWSSAQRAMARSTAVCSSGESATDAVPRSTSLT